MMNDLRLYSVNWQDGMLITQKHLKDQETYFEELVRWYALKGGDNYGLIRKSYSGKPALSLNLSVGGNRLRVEVVRCEALTPDGHYIEINGTARNVVRSETEIKKTNVPVYISADPDVKKQVGEPNPDEDLPRVPNLINSYSVHLGQPPNMPDGCHIQVADLVINGSEVSLSSEYIPPCLTIYADEGLAAKASDLKNREENLLSLSTRAYKVITSSGALAGESTGLQVAFKETINPFVAHLASTVDGFVVGPNARHPLSMIIHFKKLFRVFSTLLNLRPGFKDYLNEKFFTRELGSNVDRFMSSIEAFILAEYNHRDLGGQIRMIDEILNNLRGVVAFLAQTKKDDLGEQAVATETLTYLGRTYRNVDYGVCRLEKVGELCYLLIDIANPCPISDMAVLMSKDLFEDAEWRSMQVRLGMNEARGLGETDPIDIDTVAFGNKVALHPRDMLEASSVRQVTLIFRGAQDASKFEGLGKMDLILYAV
jgi:hypothetical protein